MKIAIMGIRGIPANYGGFETFAEELSARLVKRGHQVTVYGRSNIITYDKEYYKGVRLVLLPTISHKYFDTVAHTFLSVIYGCFKKYDVVLICNAANSLFSFIPRLAGQKVIVNVDGIERKRKKWNKIAKMYYLISEYLSTFLPNEIVADARVIQDYYLDRYNKKSFYIAYGADTNKVPTKDILNKFNLKSDEYVLYVSRLEPENNAHLLIKAYEKVKSDKKLVIVGDAPYAKDYIRELKKTKDPRIIFTGFVFGQGYKEFQCNAYCYVHGTVVGGTHPALIEAMGFGNCVLVADTPENHEVVADAGMFFDPNKVDDLREKLQFIVDNPQVRKSYREKGEERIRTYYHWDKISTDYEALFQKVTCKKSPL